MIRSPANELQIITLVAGKLVKILIGIGNGDATVGFIQGAGFLNTRLNRATRVMI
jgi:hypothetical protein